MKNDGKSGFDIWGGKRNVVSRQNPPQQIPNANVPRGNTRDNRSMNMDRNVPNYDMPNQFPRNDLQVPNYMETNELPQKHQNNIKFSNKRNFNPNQNVNSNVFAPNQHNVNKNPINRNEDYYFEQAFQDQNKEKKAHNTQNFPKRFPKGERTIEINQPASIFNSHQNQRNQRYQGNQAKQEELKVNKPKDLKVPSYNDYEMLYSEEKDNYIEEKDNYIEENDKISFSADNKQTRKSIKFNKEEDEEWLPNEERNKKPKRKLKLSKQTSEENTIPKVKAKPDQNKEAKGPTGTQLRPKIDLKKVSELEKKRKEIIKNLEKDDRERSTSPMSINMVRTTRSEEPVERKEKSFKERSMESYIPKSTQVSSINNRAKLTTMCSSKEMKEREEQNRLSIFEADPEASYYDAFQKRNILRVNPEYAVKIFSRPAADTIMDDPENIRPPEVLTKTINFLLNDIVDIDNKEDKQKNIFQPVGEEINFENISKYVEDRFRSIRQDFTILDLKGDINCIEGHEKIARFLILCLNDTLDYDAFSGQQSLFKLYIKQLNATLTSLREFYEFVNINKELNQDVYVSPFQAEFYSYSILLSIKETFDLVSMLNKMPDYIRNSDQIKLTLKIVRAIMGKEWLTFFKILESQECNYLLACVMSLYFKEMRTEALMNLSKSFGVKIKDSIYKTSQNNLIKTLLFEDADECVSFIEWFGNDTSFIDRDNLNSQFELIIIKLIGEEANLPRKANRQFIEKKREGIDRKNLINGILFKENLLNIVKPKEKKQILLVKNVLADSKPLNSEQSEKSSALFFKPETKPKEVPLPSTKENLTTIFDAKPPKDKFNLFSKPEIFINVENKKELVGNIVFPPENKLFQPSIQQNIIQPAPLATPSWTPTNTIPILNKIEQQFKQDLDKINTITNPLSHIGEIPKTLIQTNKIIAKSETDYKNNPSYKDKLTKLVKTFNKKYKSHFLQNMKIISQKSRHNDEIFKILKERKKQRLFNSIKDYCDNVKWNRYYIKELVKMKLDDFSINNFLEYRIEKIDKSKFFNYLDIKKMLECKLIETEAKKATETSSSTSSPFLYHLKINIYTEKKIFQSTQILEHLLNNIYVPNLEVEEGLYFFNMNDTNNFIPEINSFYSLFINVVFIDQIEDMTKYIEDNIQTMNKFSYGFIYINYKNLTSMENLMLLLDYATNSDNKKNFILLNYFKLSYSSFDLEDSVNNIKILEEKYKCKFPVYTIFPLKDFNLFFHEVMEYFNNLEFFSVFEKEVEIQKFKFFDMIYVHEYYKKLNFSDMIQTYLNTKGSFVNDVVSINHEFWIRFFANIEVVYMFTKTIQLVIKQIIHQIDEHIYDTLKVPHELYYNNSDSEFAEKLTKAKDIAIHLLEELCGIDIFSIFREEMQKPSFNFEKFMKFPKFYNIFSVFLLRLFNIFAGVNTIFNLEIISFREKLLSIHEEVKGKYNFKKGILFKDILYFFEKFLTLLMIKIPIDKKFTFTLDKKLFEERMNEIHFKTQCKLKELLKLFELTGLGKYMQRDENILEKYKDNFELCVERNEFVIIDEEKLKSILEMESDEAKADEYEPFFDEDNERKIYHVNFNFIKSLLGSESNVEKVFLKHKRNYEDRELQIEEIVQLEIASEISKKNQFKLLREKHYKKFECGMKTGILYFTPTKLSFNLDG